MNADLWFELDKKLIDKSVSEFKANFLARMGAGILTDPYSSATMTLTQSLFRYAKSNPLKTAVKPEFEKLQKTFTPERFSEIASFRGVIAARRDYYSTTLRAAQEADELLNSLISTRSLDQRPALELMVKDLRKDCVVAAYMHERITPTWFVLDGVVTAVVDEFPRSPITGQAVFDHFNPLARLQNYYMLSGTQADLDAFFSKLESLLHSERLKRIFAREYDGLNQMKLYLTTIQKKIDQLEVTALLTEVLA